MYRCTKCGSSLCANDCDYEKGFTEDMTYRKGDVVIVALDDWEHGTTGEIVGTLGDYGTPPYAVRLDSNGRQVGAMPDSLQLYYRSRA